MPAGSRCAAHAFAPQALALDVARFRGAAAALETASEGVDAALAFLQTVVAETAGEVARLGAGCLDQPGPSAAVLCVVPRLVGSAWTCKYATGSQQVLAHAAFCDVVSLAVALVPWIERCPPLFSCLQLLLGAWPCVCVWWAGPACACSSGRPPAGRQVLACV